MKHHMYKNANKQIEGGWRWEVHYYMGCMSCIIFENVGRKRNHKVIASFQDRDKRRVKRELRRAGWIK